MIFRRRSDRDFAEELQTHLDLEADRHQAEGMPEEEARLLARRAFGNLTSARERFYESRRSAFMDAMVRDTRYALLSSTGIFSPGRPRASARPISQ